MVRIIGTETLLHISFSLAALVFSVVLYILVCALGSGQQHKNLKFRTFAVTIVIGNSLSILDNIFRDAGIYPTPYWIQLSLLLLVYLANILLTYYMALYMEGFFGEFKLRKLFFKINTCIVVSGVALTVFVFFRQLCMFDGEMILSTVSVFDRLILGYVYELYYLLYSITLFIIFNGRISPRARMTSVAAFLVAIGAVLFESLNTLGLGSGILYNYFGAVLALYIFYIGVETPDYRNLLKSLTDLDMARRAADEANHSKSDFLANMSHEIRTPINAILGMNEMISREAEDDTILTYSENIENAGKTLLGLVNDILDFSKIEAGKIEILPADYDLSVCLNDLVNMIADRAEKKGLLLNLDFDRRLPRFLRGDEVRVKQVITNILTNAVKYTEKGSVSFSIGFEKTERPDSVLLNVSISDTGIGIKSEDLPKLFSEFERIEEKRNRNIEGTGLGMSITKRLLELMGSTLEVESEYGKGSNFHFSLEQKVVSWGELGDYEATYRDHHAAHKKYRVRFSAPEASVLVVDDNHMNLMVFKSLIKKTGIKVDTAESGDVGLELAAEKKYDVIFLDHMMPKKDGIETLRELRQDREGPNNHTPVVCLTANAISGAREQYMEEGFEDYLSKPIDSEELENMLLDLISKEKIKSTAETEEQQDLLPRELSLLSGFQVDIKEGIKNGGGIEEYLSVLDTFSETLDSRIDELERFYDEGDTKEYTIRVHALKSSLRIIGAKERGERAQLLENAGKAGDMAFIREHHAGFIREVLKLREPLSGIYKMNRKGSAEAPEAGTDFLKEIYGKIRTAAGEYDTEKLDEIFETMKGYSLPLSEEERFNKIKNAYGQLDYELILSTLDEG